MWSILFHFFVYFYSCTNPHGYDQVLFQNVTVLYTEKGMCADPVDKGAILGEGGGKPHSSDKGSQLAPDIGGGKT
jgi:hypothetical protein